MENQTLPGYSYIYKGTRKEGETVVKIYTFRATLINQTYIAEVLKLKHSIYVLQYFLKSHRLSSYRFNSILKENNNSHTFLVLNTIVNIAIEVFNLDPKASFGFMGAPIRKESDSRNRVNINPDRTVKNTKRYRVYSLYVKRYFKPEDFTHIDYYNSSCYLLKNNRNMGLEQQFCDNYLNELIDQKSNSQ